MVVLLSTFSQLVFSKVSERDVDSCAGSEGIPMFIIVVATVSGVDPVRAPCMYWGKKIAPPKSHDTYLVAYATLFGWFMCLILRGSCVKMLVPILIDVCACTSAPP